MTPAVFGHGHLRLYLLHVLAERPMHGYEIIQALSDRFGGTYVPSAGTVYPRLGKLEADGLVSRLADGRRTIYSLTPEGRAELAARSAELDDIEAGVGDSVRRLADEVRASVGEAMTSLRAELAAATREARDEARATGRRVDEAVSVVRGEGRERLHRAESAIASARLDLRTELRRAAGDDRLSEEVVSLVEQRLRDLTDEVRAALRR
ncbi:helix-turn-helix transcriptional regulator [Yonghaparkia sp. Soil809]|uniref:helix-turn-helix transcriptional regulator n=1 Tax=Yonghaparkia sp. Soil809 TaxID=1736417 RepID=UPI0006F6316E|nr:helix-turn-helix transcriptional regulator [Yonghaparkia sp. Soil809]KRF33401.1 PadR family transcriptional regulator [Yonghaparkia sp. Soil809]